MLREITVSYAKKNQQNSTVLSGHSDVMVFSTNDALMFASIVMRSAQAGTFLHALKSNAELQIRNGNRKTWINGSILDVQSHRGRDNYTHIVLSRKVNQARDSVTIPLFLNDSSLYVDDTDKAIRMSYDTIYDAIRKNTSVPVLKEWIPFIAARLLDSRAVGQTDYFGDPSRFGFTRVFTVFISSTMIENFVKMGLGSKRLSIDGCNTISDAVKEVTGIDSYQNLFGKELAEKTKKTFQPLYDPETTPISKKVEGFFNVCQYYLPRIHSYQKQKEVIQAGIMSLDHNKNLVISGETGAGKTILSIGTVVCHARKKNYSALIIVPPTLVKRWKDGIENIVPFADVHVVTNLDEFVEATKNIKNPLRIKPLWIIMSENTAKINYDEHPGVIWSEKENCYVCPHCGKPIMIKKTHLSDGQSLPRPTYLKAGMMDFLKKNESNSFCSFVRGENGTEVAGCGDALWTAATKNNSKNWIKIDKIGWLPADRISTFQENVEHIQNHMAERATKTFRKTITRYIEALAKYDVGGAIERYPNRYSIAHYIRKHMNHCFDYLIADEVHQLEGDSQQGRAFGTIISSVWRSIFLTGTLSNGYAGGLFHLLFRTQTKKMLNMGYTIDDEQKFSDDYGVKEQRTVSKGVIKRSGKQTRFSASRTERKTRRLPGISPTLVADFLMNTFVSVRKSDISDNLCPYEEIPVGVETDNELHNAYRDMLNYVQDILVINDGPTLRGGRHRVIKNALLNATMFLDQPYGLDVVRRDNNRRIELSDKTIRNKEKKLIEIAKKHKENGEKILIYVEYTNKLEIANRLQHLLEENGINAACMDAKIKQNDRQKWLTDISNDVDAVILNPSLVEVGLNLLEYTTIIFYEIGTKIMTIRQASQRSNRINQTKPVTVYFLYYKNTIQEDTLGAISQKLTASKAVEGDFSESALQKMSDDTDILTKLVNSLVKNEHIEVDTKNFEHAKSSFDRAPKTIDVTPHHIPDRSCYQDRPTFNVWGIDKASNLSFLAS